METPDGPDPDLIAAAADYYRHRLTLLDLLQPRAFAEATGGTYTQLAASSEGQVPHSLVDDEDPHHVRFHLPEHFIVRSPKLVAQMNNGSVHSRGALLFQGLSQTAWWQLAKLPGVLNFSYRRQRVLMAVPARVRQLRGAAIMIGGTPNFGHGLNDYLSKFYVLERSGLDNDRIPVLLASTMPATIKELIPRIGISAERLVTVDTDEAVLANPLIVPSMTHFYQCQAPDYSQWLRSKLAIPDQPPTPGRRLFLVRNKAGHRNLRNQQEVLDALSPLGVEPVEPAGLSLDAQLALFRDASLIVAPIGASLAAHLFAPAGCGVLELAYDGFAAPQYRIACHAAHQPFIQLVGRPIVDRGRKSWDYDFSINPEEAVDSVTKLIDKASRS